MKSAPFLFGLLFVAGSALAAPINLTVIGNWQTLDPTPNVTVSASFDSAAVDQDSWDRIGAYTLTSLEFNLTNIGFPRIPLTLQADTGLSMLHLYPSSAGTPIGEVRLFGSFINTAIFPNGLQALEFDLRLYFDDIQNDGLGALQGNLNHSYASLYLSNSLGAYSSNFNSSTVIISTGAVPEPSGLTLALLAFSCLIFTKRKDALISHETQPS